MNNFHKHCMLPIRWCLLLKQLHQLSSAGSALLIVSKRRLSNNVSDVSTEPKVVPTTTKLEGKNVAYVGGYGSIGFQCCKQLICAGVKYLTILDLEDSPSFLAELSKSSSDATIDFMRFNVTDDRKTIQRTLKKAYMRMGSIDVLINGGAIINERKPRLTVQTNLLGLMQTTLAGIQLMSLADGGKGGLIVNVSSVLGLEPGPFIAVYSATKHGVIGFTRACAHEHYYQRTGIAHIAICPGLTQTRSMSCFEGVDTFDYSKPISDEVLALQKQNPIECAKNMIIAIENGENGSIWILDSGKLKKADMKTYWNSPI